MSHKKSWKEPELEAQAARLTELLYNKTHFEHVRGKLAGEFLKVVCNPLFTEGEILKSRTQGAADTKIFLDSVAWVQERIGMLHREGMHRAAQEVVTALLEPGYRMIGELETLGSIIPITIAMFEAPLTLAVLHKKVYDKCFHTKDIPKWARKKLLYPNEFKACEPQIWKSTIFDKLQELYKPYRLLLAEQAPEMWSSMGYRYSCVCLPASPEEVQKNRQKYVFQGLLFMMKGKREDLLSHLSPEQQKKTASWQIELPDTFMQHKRSLTMGLHLKAENPYWKKMRPQFCSLNESLGRHAIINPGEAYTCFDKEGAKFAGSRLLF